MPARPYNEMFGSKWSESRIVRKIVEKDIKVFEDAVSLQIQSFYAVFIKGNLFFLQKHAKGSFK
jgi:hypothetical protein